MPFHLDNDVAGDDLINFFQILVERWIIIYT